MLILLSENAGLAQLVEHPDWIGKVAGKIKKNIENMLA